MDEWTTIDQRVTVSPTIWPDKKLTHQPGDMEVFVPGGLGLEAPIILRPWDDPLRSNPGQYYGHQAHDVHPVRNSPVNVSAGGTVYFDGGHSQDDLAVLCRLMGLHTRLKKYAVFILRGIMGGDGDWAKEALAFGLFVENSFFGVYRLWSRAWLVTK